MSRLSRADRQGANHEKPRVVVIECSRPGSNAHDGVGAGHGLSPHHYPTGKGSVHVSSGLQDALGQGRDHGDGEDVAEPLRAAWFARPRSGAPRRVRRQGHGALRTGWRPAGGYPEPTGGREDAGGDPVVHQRAHQDPGQHARPQRPHRRQRLLRQAGGVDLRAGESAQRNAASAAARQRPAGAGAGYGRHSGGDLQLQPCHAAASRPSPST